MQKTGLKPVRTGPVVFCGPGPVGNRSRLVILTKNIIYSKYYIYILNNISRGVFEMWRGVWGRRSVDGRHQLKQMVEGCGWGVVIDIVV